MQELFLSSVYNFQYLTTNFASQSAVGPHVFPLADINVFLAIYFDKVLENSNEYSELKNQYLNLKRQLMKKLILKMKEKKILIS